MAVGTLDSDRLTLASLKGNPGRMRRERAIKALFLLTAVMSIVVSALIVLVLARETWVFVSGVDPASLWTEGWFPRRGLYDVKTLFVGSVLVTAIGMAVAAPLGLGAAVFLSEYARPRVRRILKPMLEILAGIPSVVLGFFALNWISPQIVQRLNEEAALFNLMAAGIGVGILVTPLVASVAEDAMRSVPRALREASYGMGARKVTTSVRVVIPAAVSGLVAAFILGISRAIGETMVVAIAAGASGGSLFSLDVFDRGQTMTAAMAALAGGTDAVKGAGLTFQSLFFVGSLLFVLTLALNLFADRFVRRVRQRY
ncbi:MAG TPA: phosphate ABC transporter permease subunit PstC [Actinomycetota bacterium]|nr:phosphate ABC transporter permease subunit PstC [Actinomycetota bacterium]